MSASKVTQTFDLSAEDVKLAIAEFIERKYGAGEKLAVDIKSRTVSTGHGWSECDTQVVTVTATREVKQNSP